MDGEEHDLARGFGVLGCEVVVVVVVDLLTKGIVTAICGSSSTSSSSSSSSGGEEFNMVLGVHVQCAAQCTCSACSITIDQL